MAEPDLAAASGRPRAEVGVDAELARAPDPRPGSGSSARDLGVFRVELEMQTEELRRRQRELVEAGHRYRELYDAASVGYVTLNATGRIVEVNERARHLLEGSGAALVGRPLASFMGTAAADALQGQMRAAAERRTMIVGELEIVPSVKSGRGTVPLQFYLTAVLGPRGQLEGWRCVLIELGIGDLEWGGEPAYVPEVGDDPTRTAHGSVRSEELLRQLGQHIGEVVVISSRDGRRLLYVNPAVERVLERSVAEVMSQTGLPWDWIHPQDRELVRRQVDAMAKGQAVTFELRALRPDGDVRWLRARGHPIDGPDGTPRMYLGVLRDFTLERRLEQDLRHAQKMEAVGALVTGVAHDFGNILQGILGCVRLAAARDTSPEQTRGLLEHAAKAALRGGELAARLTAFGRKRDAEPRPVVVDPLLRDLAPLIEQLLTEQIEVELDLAAPDATVFADPVELEQILLNLVANARDAMPSAGALQIETRISSSPAQVEDGATGERCLVLRVRDDGLGMDEETRARIFDPFFTTKANGRGTGLGLATVYSLTRQMGGVIRVESQPGAGTTFTIRLPLVEGANGPKERSPRRPRRFAGRALLVEDDPLVRLSISEQLRALGFDIFEAESAEDALALVKLGAPVDVLVADVLLPGMRGTALAEQLTEMWPDLPVILCTANPELVDQRTSPVRVLRKPFDGEALEDAVAASLGPRAAPAPALVLVVESEPASRLALSAALEEGGHQVRAADRPSRAIAAAAAEDRLDVLVVGVDLPEMSGEALAALLRESHPDLRVVYVSRRAEVPADADAVVTKPIDFDAVSDAIDRALEFSRRRSPKGERG